MKTLDFMAGTHVASAARELVEAAKAHGAAMGMFNDIELNADAHTSAEAIVAHFEQECFARSEAHRNSAEGKAEERAANKCLAAMQAKHDALMARLPSLDWSSDEAVLNWLCEMQEPSDQVGVICRRQTIIAALEMHGFKANENCGADYKPGNRANMFRYLVGQALAGLKGPAIHPILHKFADDWRRQFITAQSADPDQRSST